MYVLRNKLDVGTPIPKLRRLFEINKGPSTQHIKKKKII